MSVALGAALLSGCISLGEKAPDQLLTLTPAVTAAAGTGVEGDLSTALSVMEPSSPQLLAVNRVPVIVDNSSIAYLKDAVWVERPARLLQRVLAETIRARGNRLVLADEELQYSAQTRLLGDLVSFSYDAPRSAVVARFDAVLQLPDGKVQSRQFESTVTGVAPEAQPVGQALNQAANDIATQVADWVN